MSIDDFKAHNVCFRDDERDSYIGEILAKIVS